VLSLVPRNTDAFESLGIPQNKPYLAREPNDGPQPKRKRIERDTTPYVKQDIVKISVQIDKIPQANTDQWSFGSDPKLCDYLLDTGKGRGVSGKHFLVYHNWESRVLMIKNLSSSNPLILRDQDDDKTSIRQGETRALPFPGCHLEVGLLTFKMEIPDRGIEQRPYDQKLEEFRIRTKDAIPALENLSFNKRGKTTPAVGKHLSGLTVTSRKYSRLSRLGCGATGSVFKGIHLESGNMVALKDFHDRTTAERISNEIRVLKSIKHVRNVLTHLTTRVF
jgi:hypothetical protein